MHKVLPCLLAIVSLGAPAHAARWPSENLIANPGIEGIDCDHVRYWVFEGKGTCVVVSDAGKAGTQAVKLTDAEGAFGLRTWKLEVPPKSEQACFEIHVKLEDSSPVAAAINWYADNDLIETNTSKPLAGNTDWTVISVTAPVPAPATSFKCVVQANDHQGAAYLDDACARVFSKEAPPLGVLSNQVGYDPGLPVRLIVQANAATKADGTFRVVDADGREIQTGALAPLGVIDKWEHVYFLAEIAELPPGDGYRVEAKVGEQSGTSYPFAVGADVVKRKTLGPAAGFYYYQRCGCEVPGWHAACHMDDARMPDGTHRDLTGGWHDAGDYNKYNRSGYTALSVYALAYAYERHKHLLDEHAKNAGLPNALDEARWGADWLLKMQDEETGRLWRYVYSGLLETAAFWGPPEEETDNESGNEDDRPVTGRPLENNNGNQQAAAALALVGRLTGEEKYVRAAMRCYEGLEDKEIRSAKGIALAVLACLELDKVLPDADYDAQADALGQRLLEHQIPSGTYAGGFAANPGEKNPQMWVTSLGLPAAALSLYALAHGDTVGIREALTAYLGFSQRLADNPFHLSKLVHHGKAVFFVSVSEKGWYVGQNSMYAMQAWALACAAEFMGDDGFLSLAMQQLDWILGRNPLSLCMCEGQGSFNPPKYHHRYNSIPGHERGAVPGCVCNGIAKPQPGPDKPTFDMRTDIRRVDWQTNEPWLPHNATYLLAVASL